MPQGLDSTHLFHCLQRGQALAPVGDATVAVCGGACRVQLECHHAGSLGGMHFIWTGVVGEVQRHEGLEGGVGREGRCDALPIRLRQCHRGDGGHQVGHDDGAPKVAGGVGHHRPQASAITQVQVPVVGPGDDEGVHLGGGQSGSGGQVLPAWSAASQGGGLGALCLHERVQVCIAPGSPASEPIKLRPIGGRTHPRILPAAQRRPRGWQLMKELSIPASAIRAGDEIHAAKPRPGSLDWQTEKDPGYNFQILMASSSQISPYNNKVFDFHHLYNDTATMFEARLQQGALLKKVRAIMPVGALLTRASGLALARHSPQLTVASLFWAPAAHRWWRPSRS